MTTSASNRSPLPRVTFWGAAQSVTGSMHLVETAHHTLLLDCGMVRGHSHRAPPSVGQFPFAPAEVDAVVLSHAHMDHCGNLPRLVQEGFAGPIYCTPATRDLVGLMLGHSARAHEEEAFVARVVGPADAVAAPETFGTSAASRVLQQCVTVPYGEARFITEDVAFQFADPAHLLGSAMIALTVATPGRSASLTFTGDLGRRASPLFREPAPLPPADLVICESTYGGRSVGSVDAAAEALESVLWRTVERGGKVLIPAFSLGRVQLVTYALQRSRAAGRLPDVPVFIDSPLAADIADVHRRHADHFKPAALEQLGAGNEFLAGDGVSYLRSAEESKELIERREPCVIISPGGMCEGGRILQHLKHQIDDPRCTIVLVNYQAPHTPGRQLLERGPTVRFHGRRWNKWADVEYLAGFSGHADHDDLLAFLAPLAERNPRVRLVHGEPEQAHALRGALHAAHFSDVEIPARGQKASFA